MKYWIAFVVAGLGVAGLWHLPKTAPTPSAPMLEEAEEREGTDHFQASVDWRLMRMRSANGTIPERGRELALSQRDVTVTATKANFQRRANNPNWQSLGPTNVMGRSRAIIVDPSNTNKIFVGNVAGGVWVSNDRGTTWSNSSGDRWKSMAIASLAFDPSNSSIVYAGTGDEAFGGSFLRGAGIYKSVDGGVSWNQLTATNAWINTNNVAVSPVNSSLILAAVNSGGLYRSTDAGASWTKVLNISRAHQVIFNPSDPTKLIAAGSGSSGDTVYYSTNSGASWTACSGVASSGYRVRIMYAKSNPTIVYAHGSDSGGKLWKSTDSGVTFTNVANQNVGAGYWANLLWVSPSDPNFVVTGGTYTWKTTNGGTSWSQISNGYIGTQQAHPDEHQMIEEPGFNGTSDKRVYITTDGGVYCTDDITTTTGSTGWYRRDLSCPTAHFYSAAGNGTSGKVYGGSQDNGDQVFSLTNSTGSWLYGGDGGFAAIDPGDDSYVYNEYVYLRVYRSIGGAGASTIISGLTDANNSSNANFIAPFILDPNNANTLLGGGASLWRTTNCKAATPTWSAIQASTGSLISAIAVAKGNSDIVWVGRNNGTVYKSTNGTAASPTWTAVTGLPARMINRITIDPANSNIVYVGLAGFNSDCLYRSTNGGTSWSQLIGTSPNNLPAAPVYGIAVHPQNSQRLYVGTEVGLYSSADGGLTWSTSDEGPATCPVEEVNFFSNSTRLLLATYGRGLWSVDVPNPAGYLSGTVTLQNLVAGAVAGQKVAIDLRTHGTTTVVNSLTATLDSSGHFSMDPQVPVGTYDLAFKGTHWLRTVIQNVSVSATGASSTASLTNGDVNGDNVVNLSDFSQLSASYGLSTGASGYVAGADLDGSGTVDLNDFSILSANYGAAGAP